MLLWYGSKRIAFPEYKELIGHRLYKGSHEESQLKVEELWYRDPLNHAKSKKIGLHIQCRCAPCGQFNKFTLIFRPYQQFVRGSLV